MIEQGQIQTNNAEVDSEDKNKKEEDLLGFSSTYKAKECEEEEDAENQTRKLIKKRKSSLDSTSISPPKDNGNSRANSKKIEDDKDDPPVERKNSSPVCTYYEGSYAYLSKTQNNFVDLKNSQNFVRKEKYFNSTKIIHRLNFLNNLFASNIAYQQNNINNYINNNIKNETSNDSTIPENIFNFEDNNKRMGNIYGNRNYMPPKNKFNSVYYMNDLQPNYYNGNYMNLDNGMFNNNIKNRKFSYNIEEEGEIASNSFNNILNLNNMNFPPQPPSYNPIFFSCNNEVNKNKEYKFNRCKNNKYGTIGEKKPFDKRKGDWTCSECKNLNFSFRIFCNRCQFPKPTLNYINTNSDQ